MLTHGAIKLSPATRALGCMIIFRWLTPTGYVLLRPLRVLKKIKKNDGQQVAMLPEWRTEYIFNWVKGYRFTADDVLAMIKGKQRVIFPQCF